MTEPDGKAHFEAKRPINREAHPEGGLLCFYSGKPKVPIWVPIRVLNQNPSGCDTIGKMDHLQINTNDKFILTVIASPKGVAISFCSGLLRRSVPRDDTLFISFALVDPVKSLLERHPGESRGPEHFEITGFRRLPRTPSGVRRNDDPSVKLLYRMKK